MHIDRETKIVKLSVVVLCFALIFVYLVWFYVKGEQLKIINDNIKQDNTILSTNHQEEQNLVSHENEKLDIKKTTQKIPTIQISTNTPETPQPTITIKTKKKIPNIEATPPNNENKEVIVTEKETFTPSTVTERKILSGTKIVEGTIEFAEVLGVTYKYALRDSKGIEYLYLGKGMNNDFVDIVNQYDGTIHTIDTEYEIKQNELFGERVVFLNLPWYYKKLVLMIVKYDEQYWLLSIDYLIYHKSKKYLKHLFTD